LELKFGAVFPVVRLFFAYMLVTLLEWVLFFVLNPRQGVESELLEASLKFNLYLNAGKP
jgi:hypothetical protein